MMMWPNLNTLDIANNPIGDEGITHLTQSPNTALTTIDLYNTNITDEGVALLLTAPWIAQLNTLNLAHNTITNKSAQAIAQCEALRHIKTIELYKTHIDGDGIAALQASPHLSHLFKYTNSFQ